jgi:hypothetical protein
MSFVIGSPNTTGQPERHVDFTAGLLQATLSTRNIQAIVAPLWDGPQIETPGRGSQATRRAQDTPCPLPDEHPASYLLARTYRRRRHR